MSAAEVFRAAVVALEAHELAAAAARCTELEALGDPRAAVIRAHLRVAEFDPDGAIEELEQSLAATPSAAGWHCLAALLAERGRADDARSAFERAEACGDVPRSVVRVARAGFELERGDAATALILLSGVETFETAALRDTAEAMVLQAHRVHRALRLAPAALWRVRLDGSGSGSSPRLVVQVEGFADTPDALVRYATELGVPADSPVMAAERVRVDPGAWAGVTRLGRIG